MENAEKQYLNFIYSLIKNNPNDSFKFENNNSDIIYEYTNNNKQIIIHFRYYRNKFLGIDVKEYSLYVEESYGSIHYSFIDGFKHSIIFKKIVFHCFNRKSITFFNSINSRCCPFYSISY